MRIYDPRIGRFLSVDPITESYPQLSPYQFGSNRPIDGVDFDGLEWIPYRKWTQDYDKGGVAAIFANVTTNTVLGAVNAVAGVGMGAKNGAVYLYKAFTGKVNPKADATTAYNNAKSKVSSFVSQPNGKIAKDVLNSATSPEAYGAAVGFLSLGGGNLTKGWGGKALSSAESYIAKSFDTIIKGAKNITKNGALETNLLVEGSATEAFGGLMAKYGKTVDDLTMQATKQGSSASFSVGNESYTFYNQASKGDFVELTLSKTVKQVVKDGTITKTSTKVRFTKD